MTKAIDGAALQGPGGLAEAMDLVTHIYRVMPSNIAEGQAHHSHREFLHFLRHSAGSLAEVETQLLIAERIGYIDRAATAPLIEKVHEVGRILNGLITSLRD